MKIVVESLLGATEHILKNQEKTFAIITVTDSALSFNKDGKIPHLVLRRDDVDESFSEEILKQCGPMFTEEDGVEVKSFVETHRHSVDYFLIHCDAGISRSRGVAAALSYVYNGTEEEHFEWGSPNPTVRKHVLKAYGLVVDYPERKREYCFWCGEEHRGVITFREDPEDKKYKAVHVECSVAFDRERVLYE